MPKGKNSRSSTLITVLILVSFQTKPKTPTVPMNTIHISSLHPGDEHLGHIDPVQYKEQIINKTAIDSVPRQSDHLLYFDAQ